ncbi:uncharacterized protein TRAVEDRAFT_53459 [Trametes versicolor FP-101664 SS1]|uniref:uncharacterized protein n=1 Tax=Trametes versicolor (strain FP-101664) TaxID=717944 RepID=UPI00046230AC|nr:uncharacterized protein TRAVEDRAFT_53459 [Trametes versicolor FP-101664 SS1]EIW53042.1 hypothetical protein TRAVEDRAFT_53459 [Trametes versicolor FP-101664 SS1]
MDAPTALFLPSPPPLDNTFGAFLLGTFLGLVLYGVTIHQAYRYIRLYHNDGILVKVFVVCIFVVETLQISTCMHTCYFYLVTNYFDPQALARGVWSIQAQSVICALEVFLSQSFFARRVYLVRPQYKVVVALAVSFSIVALAFGTATTVQGIKIHTFTRFQHYTWMDSVAFAAAVASDALTTGVLIYVLKASRTGFKKTDHIIDRLTLYAVNTGFLTGVFDLLALIFAVVYPDNLVYFAFSIVATKVYANSLLAVLNTRHSGAEGRDPGSTIGIHAVSTHNETRVTVAGMWNAQQMPKNHSETAIELKTSDTSSV